MEDDKDNVTTNTEDKNNSDSNEKIDMEQMKSLIPVMLDGQDRQVVDGRTLYEGLKLNEDSFNSWMTSILERLSAKEGQHYVKFAIGKGRGEIFIYQLTIDLAKRIAMVAGAMPNVSSEAREISNKVQEYFLWCERLILGEEKFQKPKLLLDIYNGGQEAVIASKQLTELEIKEATEKLEEKIDIITTHSLTIEESRDALNKLIRAVAYKKYNGAHGQAWNEFYSHLNYKLHINVRARNKTRYQSLIDTLTEEELFKAEEIARVWANDLGIDVAEILGLNLNSLNEVRQNPEFKFFKDYLEERKQEIENDNLIRLKNFDKGRKSRKKPVLGVHARTGEVVRFDSGAEAARELGIKPVNITNCLKGFNKTSAGYKWYYAKDYDGE